MKPTVPSRILELDPYEPGKPIEEVERELGISGSIKLASNENALGPSPAALAALKGMPDNLHRYPDGNGTLLRQRLAEVTGTGPEQIVLGNGSNEIIELLLRTFVVEGDEVLMSEDAFLIYRLATLAVAARPVTTPSRDHRHDLEAMAAAVVPATRLIFLANPNNPTGTIYSRDEWELFLRRVPERVLVVVDEAYFDYVDDADYPATFDYLGSHAGLVVVRTFSKAHGLAGLRVGYCATSADIAGAMQRVRQPFNVGSLAQAAALAALDDEDHIAASKRLVRAARLEYAGAFKGMGLDFVPSQANFVLVDVGDGKAVTEAMLGHGVIVRSMEAYGMPTKVRISFGTAEENERCIAVLREVIATTATPGTEHAAN